jgi:glutamine cyclotransferase
VVVAAAGAYLLIDRSPGPAVQEPAPVYGYEVVNVYPHDPAAFTQGLVYRDGVLFESTGLSGRSSIRKVRLETGEVLERRDLEPRYFGEGLAHWNDRLIQLTWQSNVAFVYDAATFEPRGTFSYRGEGWGLTREGDRLLLSDGSPALRVMDPATFEETGRLTVTDAGRPIFNLNELEVVRGEIFANIWQTDRIARITPDTGRVTGWIDLAGLLPAADRAGGVDVLNGIAYDAEGDRLFVTGKLWPKLFQIRVVPR